MASERKTAVLVTASLVALFATGCSPHKIVDEKLATVGESEPVRWRVSIDCMNEEHLAGSDTRQTLADRCRDDGRRDFVGISLSGGGTKAAVFGAETLFYLQALGLLRQTAVVSSVSGGSFAASYYSVSCDPNADGVCSEPDPNGLHRPVWTHDTVLPDLGQGYGDLVHQGVVRLLSPIFGGRVEQADFASYIDRHYFHSPDGRPFRFRDINPRRPHLFLNSTITSVDRVGLETSPDPPCRPIARAGYLRRRNADEYFHFAFTKFYFNALGSNLDDYPVSGGVAASAAFPVLIGNAHLQDFCRNGTDISLMDGGANDNQGLIEIYATLAELVFKQHRSDLWRQPDKLETFKPSDRAWIFVVDSSVTETTGPTGAPEDNPLTAVGAVLSITEDALRAIDVYSGEGDTLRQQLYLDEKERLAAARGYASIHPIEVSLKELDQYRLGGTESALRVKAAVLDPTPETDAGAGRARERRDRQRETYERIVDRADVRRRLGLSDWHPQCYYNIRAKLDSSLISLSKAAQACLRDAARWAMALRAQEICGRAPQGSLHPPGAEGLRCSADGTVELVEESALGKLTNDECSPLIRPDGPLPRDGSLNDDDFASLPCRNLATSSESATSQSTIAGIARSN